MTSLYAWFYYIKMGCEPTYEELKRNLKWEENNPDTGCEPTYEELKPISGYIIFATSFCCEPTYEELKLVSSEYRGLLAEVASLPMRNWNLLPLLQKLLTFLQLRAYLWGIETILFLHHHLYRMCCEPTYEELKLSSGLINGASSIPVASLPMRNWNILGLVMAGLTLLCCEPTYEELKLLLQRGKEEFC